MLIKKRKEYRMKLLEEVYEHYFQNNGEPLEKNINEGEEALAFKYLKDKEFVDIKIEGQQTKICITEKGIDIVEYGFRY